MCSVQLTPEQQKALEAMGKKTSPVITSANVAAPHINTQDRVPDEILVDDDAPIVAKPLVDPDFTKLRPKNKALTVFWGNRVANNGLRIEDLKARGFRVAKVEDFEGPPVALIKDGKIIRGDLLALIIPTRDYLGQQLHNAQTAERRVSRQQVIQDGKNNLQEDLRAAGGLPARHKGKISVFQPTSFES